MSGVLDSGRTAFLDFLPLSLGVVSGHSLHLHLFTAPGLATFRSACRAVLQGVDGVVFVADSQAARRSANIQSLSNLVQLMEEIGLDSRSVPLVLQLNKQDLPSAAPRVELLRDLGHGHGPVIEAVANEGEGVFSTLTAITKLLLAQAPARKGLNPFVESDFPI